MPHRAIRAGVREMSPVIQKEKVIAYFLFGDPIDSFTVVILKREHRTQIAFDGARRMSPSRSSSSIRWVTCDNLWLIPEPAVKESQLQKFERTGVTISLGARRIARV